MGDKTLRWGLSAIVGLGSIFFLWIGFKFIFFMSTPASNGPAQFVHFEVTRNLKSKVIAQELNKLGVVSDPELFVWYGRLTRKNKKFKAGDYRFSTAMTPTEVFTILMSGISYATPVTIPEGYHMRQIADLFESQRAGLGKEFLKLCRRPSFIKKVWETYNLENAPETLEGYLFPDTYLIGRNTDASELAHHMVRKFKQVYTPEIAEKAKNYGFTTHEVLTLASIIEKETGAPHERPLVSSVFHNRLKKKMKLQTDPTVIYGMGENYHGNITRKDLLAPTPYNTYVIKGLPPGPIGNPGKEAIAAAVDPAESRYLFFASHNDGTHEFSETVEQHNAAVRKYLIDKKAREGRSWREMTQKLGKDKPAPTTSR